MEQTNLPGYGEFSMTIGGSHRVDKDAPWAADIRTLMLESAAADERTL